MLKTISVEGACRLTIGAIALCTLILASQANDAQSRAATAATSKSPLVTPRGVGGVQLGATVASLHKRHLIGRLRQGCELDPGQRVARLRAPLNGFAIFGHPNDRVSSIVLRGNAKTARHVGIGSRPGEVTSAYPHATYDPPGSNDPFAEGFIWVNQIAHPKLTFTVDADTRLISEISVPSPNFCE
jgi:hypothetical protein